VRQAISELTLDAHEDEVEDNFGDDDADDAFIDVDTTPLAGRPPGDEEKTQMIKVGRSSPRLSHPRPHLLLSGQLTLFKSRVALSRSLLRSKLHLAVLSSD
jgi:hypothetical protein